LKSIEEPSKKGTASVGISTKLSSSHNRKAKLFKKDSKLYLSKANYDKTSSKTNSQLDSSKGQRSSMVRASILCIDASDKKKPSRDSSQILSI